MDNQDKKRRIGQGVAFYTALAVCLTAVGVGTWQLLQPDGAAQSGTAAVSSSAALPDTPAPAPDMDAPPEPSATETASAGAAATDAPQAVSGAASIATDAKSGGSSADSGSTAKSADSGNTAKSADSGNTAKGADSGNTTKSSAKSPSSSNAKSAESSKPSKTEKSGAVRPVEGKTVTAYSMDKLLYNETMRDWRTHDGVDIAADAGTAVVAAKAGTVESVAADPVMGMTVTVRHEGKWETVYSSLTDAPEVEAGDEVSAGQVVGYVGETAASESALGPHLHFAVLNDGAPSDPEAFLS